MALVVCLAALGPAVAQEPPGETDADLLFEFAERLFQLRDKAAPSQYRKFIKAFRTDPRREEARYKLAVALFSFGPPGKKTQAQALAELVSLRKEFPDGKRIQDCLFRSGHVRYLLGDPKGALGDLLELAKRKVRPDLRISMHHFLGRATYDLGQNEAAAKHLSVVAGAPKAEKLRPYALVILADAYLKLDKVKESATALDLLLKDYPQLPNRDEMRLKLGNARLVLKQFREALAAYSRVDPKGAFRDRSSLGKGRALLGLGKHDEARTTCQALLARFRETPATQPLGIPQQCLYVIGLANFGQAQYARAADVFVKLLAKVQQGGMAEDAAHKLCWSYLRQGDKLAKKLVAGCVSFRRLFPSSRWTSQVVFLRAEGHLRLGEYADAIAYYRKVGEKEPNYPDALYRMAYCYHKDNKPEEAARAYDVFVKKYKSHRQAAAAIAAAGGLYQAAGRHQEALDRYDAYLKLAPDGPEAEEVMYQRGICYGKLSQFDKMAAAFVAQTRKFGRGPYAGPAFHWLGRYHRIRGDKQAEKGDTAAAAKEYGLAEEAFRSSAALTKRDQAEILFALAECHYNLGKNQSARAAKLAEKAKLADGPEKKQLEDQVAALRKQAGESLKRAAQGFLKTMLQKPALVKDESVYLWAGAHFRERGDPRSAVQVFDALLRNVKNSKKADLALYQLVTLHGAFKPPAHQRIIRYCDQLLDRFPAGKFALQTKFAKAEALYALKKRGPAEKLYMEVARKGNGFLKVSSDLKLGHLYFARREYAAARARFLWVALLYDDRALTPEALYFASKCNVLLNDPPEAVKYWQQLLRNYPDSKWAARARAELPSLGYVVKPDGTIAKP